MLNRRFATDIQANGGRVISDLQRSVAAMLRANMKSFLRLRENALLLAIKRQAGRSLPLVLFGRLSGLGASRLDFTTCGMCWDLKLDAMPV